MGKKLRSSQYQSQYLYGQTDFLKPSKSYFVHAGIISDINLIWWIIAAYFEINKKLTHFYVRTILWNRSLNLNFFSSNVFIILLTLFFFQVHPGEMTQDFIDELELVHNLRHERLTPIEEIRQNEEGYVIIYRTNRGNLKGNYCTK